jgi:hypothetical protein
LLARIVRDEDSRRKYGDNQDILWKPDGLALAVIVSKSICVSLKREMIWSCTNRVMNRQPMIMYCIIL